MNTYVVTFYDENDGDPTDIEVRVVNVSSAVDPDELTAGECDAHELLVRQARQQWNLTGEWEAVLVGLPSGGVVAVPAGL